MKKLASSVELKFNTGEITMTVDCMVDDPENRLDALLQGQISHHILPHELCLIITGNHVTVSKKALNKYAAPKD